MLGGGQLTQEGARNQNLQVKQSGGLQPQYQPQDRQTAQAPMSPPDFSDDIPF